MFFFLVITVFFLLHSMPWSLCFVCCKATAPVVSKRLFILRVQCSSWGEHDGGVQVSNDARNSAGRCDTCLGAFVSRLQCWQYQGHLEHTACKHIVRSIKTAKITPDVYSFHICNDLTAPFFFIGYCLDKPGKCVRKCLEWKIWTSSIKGGCWEQEKREESKLWVCCTITLSQWAWLCKLNIFLEECSLPILNKQMENPERCILTRHKLHISADMRPQIIQVWCEPWTKS